MQPCPRAYNQYILCILCVFYALGEHKPRGCSLCCAIASSAIAAMLCSTYMYAVVRDSQLSAMPTACPARLHSQYVSAVPATLNLYSLHVHTLHFLATLLNTVRTNCSSFTIIEDDACLGRVHAVFVYSCYGYSCFHVDGRRLRSISSYISSDDFALLRSY